VGGLRTVFADRIGKHDPSADGQFGKRPVNDAVSMKINLLAIACLKESEFTGGIQSYDGSDGLTFVAFEHALHAPRAILKSPSCPLKRIVMANDKSEMSLVIFRRPPDIDFTTPP
jgi:hypothetical protein